MPPEEELINERKRKREELLNKGINPYPYNCDPTHKSTEIQSKYTNHSKTAYVKKKGGRNSKLTPSKELKELIGKEAVTRGDATKKLWEYIKANNLQDPENKRSIVPDEKMTAFFGNNKPVDMFKLATFLSKHLS